MSARPYRPERSRYVRAQAALFGRMMSLPPAALRRAAGKPVVREGRTLSPYTQLALRLKQLSREKSPAELSLEAGRRAVVRQSWIVGGDLPIGSVHERTVRGAEGPLDARLYVPRGVTEPGPLLVFLHGGGFIYGDLDSHDAPCRFLAEQAGVRVLAVDYRLAPEAPYPAAREDAWAAYEWVASKAHEFGGDPDRLAVGGDSAGGNLAALTALRAAEEGVRMAFQLLIYPGTDFTASMPSRELLGEGFYLDRRFTDLAASLYLGDHDRSDPGVSVLFAKIPEGVAPAAVVTAGFDPLRDEGQAYAEKLREAGVDVAYREFPSEIHSFVNVVGVPGSARDAMAEVAGMLRAGLT